MRLGSDMSKPHLIVDVALCQGCNNCLMACKDEHTGNEWPGYSRPQSKHTERWIQIPCNERGRYPLVDVVYRPTLCTHCAEPPCAARSKGAICKRADGLVLINPSRAAGQRELVESCPYGMISWSDESSVAQKCTLCAHLLDAGWAKPRCVQACGPGALSFVVESGAEFAARAAAEGLETLHPGRVEDTGVCYKNLGRYDSCFIAGSVAVERGGVVDCAVGVEVVLRKAAASGAAPDAADTGTADASVVPLQTVVTDAFGDFKFDGLVPDSGAYEIEVALNGGAPVKLSASLGRSVTLGTITLRGER